MSEAVPMGMLGWLSVATFVGMIANDFLLARKVRRAQSSGRLECAALAGFRPAGVPIGLVLNLYRLRMLPGIDDLSDPECIAIRRRYFLQLALLALLGCSVMANVVLTATG